MKNHISFIVKCLIFFGIMNTVNSMWRLLEYIEFGQPMPSWSDTIIGAVLAYSLYRNLRLRIRETEEE